MKGVCNINCRACARSNDGDGGEPFFRFVSPASGNRVSMGNVEIERLRRRVLLYATCLKTFFFHIYNVIRKIVFPNCCIFCLIIIDCIIYT